MFVGKGKSGATEKNPALLENIQLGWKGLQGTNTLAYYEHL